MPAELRPHIKVHKCPQLARMQMDAGAIGVSTATVWIEVDTGMHRAGVDTADQAVELARHVSKQEGLRLLGVTGYEPRWNWRSTASASTHSRRGSLTRASRGS